MKKIKKVNKPKKRKYTKKAKDFKLPPHEAKYIISTLSQKQGWGIKQSKVPNTWTVTMGEGMTAVVIDTGWPDHADLGDNSVKGKNFVPGESIKDLEGHQTHCTGIICAQNNSKGMVGVAPKAKCIAAKALDKNGSGSFDSIIAALEYALEIKADVVSMSLGAPHGTKGLHNAIKALYDADIPVICAAGNDGKRGVDYPGALPETIAIGAYDKHGNIAGFSGVGEEVEWATPGVDIYSTYLNNKYCMMSGTSMATPFMTGVVLLLLAKHKKQEAETGKNDCKTVEQVREHLLKYTVDKGIIGKDENFGYGVVDIEDLILEGSAVPIPVPVPSKRTLMQKLFAWFKGIFG